MKKSTQRVILWTLMALFLAPFTCCGLGYSFLYASTPVTWTYETDSVLPLHEHIKFGVYLQGSDDYYMDESGPRHIGFGVDKDSPETQISVRLLELEAVGSKSGKIQSYLPDSLPLDLPFTAGREGYKYQTWADWKGLDFDIEPSSKEIITVTIKIEIHNPDGSIELMEWVTVFRPNRIHRPLTYWMPSV
ncbi:MAG: hypothetical protein JKX70_03995 [Phycisphaerales bacterium]|nr:hypothetical protein [Phycisphaerales bacterium]